MGGALCTEHEREHTRCDGHVCAHLRSGCIKHGMVPDRLEVGSTDSYSDRTVWAGTSTDVKYRRPEPDAGDREQAGEPNPKRQEGRVDDTHQDRAQEGAGGRRAQGAGDGMPRKREEISTHA